MYKNSQTNLEFYFLYLSASSEPPVVYESNATQQEVEDEIAAFEAALVEELGQ